MADSKPHPPARIMRALTFADLLDAAGIASIAVEGMSQGEWDLLAAAARIRIPSEPTRALVLTLLRQREAARAQLFQFNIQKENTIQ